MTSRAITEVSGSMIILFPAKLEIAANKGEDLIVEILSVMFGILMIR